MEQTKKRRLNVGVASILFILLGMLAAGCAKEEPVIPNPDEELGAKAYFPATVGDIWEYEGQGNEYASFYREVVYGEGDLAQFSEDNGGTVTATVYSITEDVITQVFFKGEEYEDTNFLAEEPNADMVILKAPLSEGTQWNTENGSRKIVDLDATVDTPAGQFLSCIQVEVEEGDSTLYEYFAPEVGMVKREFIMGEEKVTSSLSDFSIGPK